MVRKQRQAQLIDDLDYGLGLSKGLNKRLQATGENSRVICEYVRCLGIEIRLSENYKKMSAFILVNASVFANNKDFKEMTKDDNVSFLNSVRKTENEDPLHRWVSTYNTYLMVLGRFFKWFYHPDLSPKQRPKPSCVEIPNLKRREQSVYKPTDLWTQDDDILFLKYCPSKRDRCYHAISRDSSCRPHELLKLRIKDVVFKMAGDRQYAEVVVNGKTGQRHIPLINSIPYLKDWIDNHPQSGNPDTILICGLNKSLGRSIRIESLNYIYKNYKKEFFPRLLNNPNVPIKDKEKIKELLKKPWNPYIRRHSALTEKSKILKEQTLRQHAGWTATSKMIEVYVHYFGNESNESLLEAYGLKPKLEEIDKLKPKSCPNCQESNKINAKFCSKCRMVLSYDEYTQVTQQNEEFQETRFQKLEAKIDALARHFWKNNVTRGITLDDARPLTDEEIEHELSMRRQRARLRHTREKQLLQELHQ